MTDTASEQFRHECEVRYVAALPTKHQRQEYLAGVRRHRGDAAVERIKADLWKLHERAAA